MHPLEQLRAGPNPLDEESRSKIIPAIAPVMKHAIFAAIIALKASLDKCALRVGAKELTIGIIKPMEHMLENPHRA